MPYASLTYSGFYGEGQLAGEPREVVEQMEVVKQSTLSLIEQNKDSSTISGTLNAERQGGTWISGHLFLS